MLNLENFLDQSVHYEQGQDWSPQVQNLEHPQSPETWGNSSNNVKEQSKT